MTKLHYTIYPSTQTGLVQTREPNIVQIQDTLEFIFEPALPETTPETTAIFENADGNTLYRQLAQTACTIPASFLNGTLKICLADMHGNKMPTKLNCEPLTTKRTPQGILVYPSDADLPKQIAALHNEVQKVSTTLETLTKQYKKTEQAVETMLNGYDFD